MKIKSLLFCSCFLAVMTAKAQNWGGGIDDTDLHFGFTFQYISSEYKILKKPYWRSAFPDPERSSDIPDSLRSISSAGSPGFGIGFVVNQRINDNMDLRLTPGLVFNDRISRYDFEDGTFAGLPFERKTQTTVVELPLSLKLKSNRRNNFRAYMMGGAKLSTDISSKKKSDNSLVTDPMEKFLNNRRNFFSYEGGIGFDLYFEYFKMSPEIKLSYSMKSVLKDEAPHIYSYPIDKLMLRHVTFSLFFE